MIKDVLDAYINRDVFSKWVSGLSPADREIVKW